jgi:hypothetical protein
MVGYLPLFSDPINLLSADIVRWNRGLGKTSTPHPLIDSALPSTTTLQTNKATHYVLAAVEFEASNEIEGSHEEPDRDSKANI